MNKVLKKFLAYTLILCELFQTVGVYALTKEESVYVKLKENGEINNISISEHLYGFIGDTINDKSILRDIKNIDGNSSFKIDGNNIIWKTNSDNIYYQGSYKYELPIEVSVKYYLNGEEKEVKDILGQKGKIKIELTYKNNSYKYLKINGKLEKLYVPYAIVMTSILSNIDNKNIGVTNGKIIDNGIGSTVVAVASPGLYESLKIDELKGFDKIEVTYDTDNFELSSIYSVATTDLFSNSGITDAFGKVNDLYKNINLLQTNMDKIVSTSKELSNGAAQMNEGISAFNQKVQNITDKYKHLRNADKEEIKSELIKIIKEYISSAIPKLREKITSDTSKIMNNNKKELKKSLVNYTKNNTRQILDDEISDVIYNLNINNLVENISNNILYNIINNEDEIKDLNNNFKNEIANTLGNAIDKVVKEFSDGLNINMSHDEKNEYINHLKEKYGVTYEQALGIFDEVQNDNINKVKDKLAEFNITGKVMSILNSKHYLDSIVKDYIDELNEKLGNVLNDDKTISDYASNLKENIVNKIQNELKNDDIFNNANLNEQIDDIVNNVIKKTTDDLSNKYTTQALSEIIQNIIDNDFNKEDIYSKLKELFSKFENIITEKISRIDNAIYNLSDSFNMLDEGSYKLAIGMNDLSKGLEKYNKEGIKRLSNLINGDVKSVEKRLESLIELSKENSIIDDSDKDTNTRSKLVFMIDSISKPVESKIDNKTETKKVTLWDKIIGLFK